METIALLRASPLFRSLSDAELLEAIRLLAPKSTSFPRGDILARTGEQVSSLTFITEGSATVFRDAEHKVLLNRLSVGDCFGAANLFAKEAKYPTEIVASSNVTCLSVTEDALRAFLLHFPTSALDYISFLSDRIRFLNRRVQDFSYGTAEEKVASLLLSFADKDGKAMIPNLRAAAESMNIGRASLYRVLSALSDRALIEKDGKQIQILDQNELKGILTS